MKYFAEESYLAASNQKDNLADFYVKLRRLAEEVDLCPGTAVACEETQLKMIILMGIRDADLVQKLIALDVNSSLQDFITTCRSYEAAKTATSAIRAPTNQLCAVSAYKRSKKSSGKHPPSPKPSNPATWCQYCAHQHDQDKCPAANSTCKSCDRVGHWSRTMKCPASKVQCCLCHRIGHFDKCCRENKKNLRQDRSSSNSGASSVNKSQDSRTRCRRLGLPRTISKTPKPICVLLSFGDVKSRIKMLPDTGADVTVIGKQHLDTLGISRSCLQTPPQSAMFTADGSPMSPALEVKHVNRVKELPISATTSPSAAKEYFLQEFQDVLVSKEELKTAPLKPMAGPPMRIHLKDGAVPFAIHTPRQIPFAFKDQVKEELDSMVAQGIIKPAGDDPSVWCHPLVVVPKNGTGVRITVDLTKLNSQVSRPAHPSPTPYAAIRSVGPKARYFTTADALYGYWQMELAEEDQHLTTFITPYGRFIHCRGPMGFAATGDAFCLRGDMALQGVQNCVKVLDDLLLHDEDYATHLHRIHEVLTRCRKFGITLTRINLWSLHPP
ncbi:uncharacterized protein LOC135199066 [Macrobrachium nipponense]|uniref:uncharacterized protein LOC135199066 n=1 Tax=Macrobrachium nipponense TaxID=159736 RepID=UPI0030C7DF01